jgi:hypothetical protein
MQDSKKGGYFQQPVVARQGAIRQMKTDHSIRLLCHTLEVSRSGFHAWTSGRNQRRARADQALRQRLHAALASHAPKLRLSAPERGAAGMGRAGRKDEGNPADAARKDSKTTPAAPCSKGSRPSIISDAATPQSATCRRLTSQTRKNANTPAAHQVYFSRVIPPLCLIYFNDGPPATVQSAISAQAGQAG